ncbi:CDP-glycerol glycerophosphotransferase family protein [Colwellia sp. MEBiC06753]
MLHQITKFLASIISVFIPTKKNIFLFGSWFGNKYGDNARYFFEYVVKNHPEIESYWVTKSDEVFQQLTTQNLPVIKEKSWLSLWLHLRSKAVFCNTSHESDLWGRVLNSRTVVFNLWHGTPIKKIGLDAISDDISAEKLGVSSRTTLNQLLPKSLYLKIKSFVNKRTYFLASSEEIGNILQSAMGVKASDIIVEGYPKLDHLINAKKSIANGQLLYAPTYRGVYNSESDLLAEFGFDAQAINDWLSVNNKELTIRLHPANALPQSVITGLKGFDRIKVGDTRDLYESLIDYELVITDFSSLYYDCLAINVPIVLAPFGLESYIANDRALYFSPDELYPYQKAENWPQLIEVLTNRFEHPVELSAVKERFYVEKEGLASSKLFTKVISKLHL